MNADRRRFISGIGRCMAGGALAAVSARLVLCRRNVPKDFSGIPCPPCPWWDLCPTRSSTPPRQGNTEGDETHG